MRSGKYPSRHQSFQSFSFQRFSFGLPNLPSRIAICSDPGCSGIVIYQDKQ